MKMHESPSSSSTPTDSAITRRQALGWFAAIAGAAVVSQFAAPSFSFAAEQAEEEKMGDVGFDHNAIKTTELAKGAFLITGPGGNIFVQRGADGALVIDSGITPRAADTLAAVLALLTETGLTRLLVNTHWHFDHAGGNDAFGLAGFRIISSENCRTRLATPQHNAFMHMDFPPAPAAAIPPVTFTQDLTIRLNDEVAILHAFAPAHTDGDVMIHFEKLKIWHGGDILFFGMFPFIDNSSGGSVDGMIAAHDRFLTMIKPGEVIIPGHGPVGGKAEVQALRDMLSTVRDRIAPLAKKGVTVEEAVKLKPLADLDAKWGQVLFRASHFTRLAYMSYAPTK